MFEDLVAANEEYRSRFHRAGIEGRAARGLAVLTCMDTRLDPLAMLGLAPGDAKIIRNAGGRVTDDALRSLILATNLLGVTRICVIQHTRCAMVGTTEDDLREQIGGLRHADASGWEFLTMSDQPTAIHDDIGRIRGCPLIPPDVDIGSFIFDVDTGELRTVLP